MDYFSFPRTDSALNDEPRYPNLEQLMCLALADSEFAAALIQNPCHVDDLKSEQLRLTAEERVFLCSVRDAHDIHEFAARLYRHINEQA